MVQPLRYEGVVLGAMFSPDESLLLSWSQDGTSHLLELSADYDFPVEHLPLLIEVVTGTTMDDWGYVSPLSLTDWIRARKEYAEIAQEHLRICQHRNVNLYLTQRSFWESE